MKVSQYPTDGVASRNAESEHSITTLHRGRPSIGPPAIDPSLSCARVTIDWRLAEKRQKTVEHTYTSSLLYSGDYMAASHCCTLSAGRVCNYLVIIMGVRYPFAIIVSLMHSIR